MFSWITGPRITNVVADLQADPALDTTFVEPPETPAPVFVARAFKHAIFGTPAPEEARDRPTSARRRNTEPSPKKPNLLANGVKIDASAIADERPMSSPSKPNGILMTPGTARGKKTVSFGAHVVDNEGRRGTLTARSGLPNDYPGKFPSPWTPATQPQTIEEQPKSLESGKDKNKEKSRDQSKDNDKNKDKKPRTKLTAALYDARKSTPAKTRDDSDITLNFMEPRSESGKYWKEQYMSYKENSEAEMKRIINKQKVAKDYAKRKDAEAMELATRLGEERKRYKIREKALEDQCKDYQERLRKSMAENLSASMEVAALKSRIAVLEASFTVPSEESKASIQIYEDSRKESVGLSMERSRTAASKQTPPSVSSPARKPTPALAQKSSQRTELPSIILGKPISSNRDVPAEDGRSPQRPHQLRRNTVGNASTVAQARPSSSHQNDLRSTSSHMNEPRPTDPQNEDRRPTSSSSRLDLPVPSLAGSSQSSLSSKSPLSDRVYAVSSKENIPPAGLFSPLNQHPPSPDPWLGLESSDFDDSPMAMNKMALPMSTAPIQPTRRPNTQVFSRGAKTGGVEKEKENQRVPAKEPTKEKSGATVDKAEAAKGNLDTNMSAGDANDSAYERPKLVVMQNRKAAAAERLQRRRLQKQTKSSILDA